MTQPLTRNQLEEFIAKGVPALSDTTEHASGESVPGGLKGFWSDITYRDGFTAFMVENGAMRPVPAGPSVWESVRRAVDAIRLVRPASLGGLTPRRPVGA